MTSPPNSSNQTSSDPSRERQSLIVKGQIRTSDNTPRPGSLVRVYDKDMRSEELLGAVTAGDDGRYEITYTAAQFQRAEKGSADLRIAVVNADGREIASSKIVFNAGPETTIDVVVGSGDTKAAPEYERLIAELTPVMQGVPLWELTDDDVTFLAGESGEDRQRIAWLGDSARRARELEANGKAIPAEAFYGWWREGMPTTLDELWAQSVDVLVAALKRAIAENIVAEKLGAELEKIAAVVNGLKVDRVLKPGDKGRPASLGDVLAVLPQRLSTDKERLIAGVLRDRSLPGVGALRMADLNGLVASKALTSEEADRVALATAAYHLTGASPEAAAAVLALRPDATGTQGLARVADLAALDDAHWLKVIAAAPAILPSGVKAADFASQLTGRVARLVPLEFIANRTTTLPSNLSALVANADRMRTRDAQALKRSLRAIAASSTNATGPADQLVQLVRRNPGLALDGVLAGGGDVPTKVKEIQRRVGLASDVVTRNAGKNLLGLDHSPDSTDTAGLTLPEGDADRQIVLRNIRAHQRAFMTGGDASTAITLLDNGFDAARKVVEFPVEQFSDASGLSAEQAIVVYRQATKLATAAAVKGIAVIQSARPGYKPGPVVLSDQAEELLAKIPGYAALFDEIGFCDCTECQSVLGLSAYFIDLMHFVDQNILSVEGNFVSNGNPQHMALHLKTRRSDLWNKLEVTCENASEVVAYLDVVNGVLETYLGTKLPGDIWETIAGKAASFSLPFHWPLERIETYLGHFEKRRLDALLACGADELATAQARLGLSEIEYGMIIQPAAVNPAHPTLAERDFLERLYRSDIPILKGLPIQVLADGQVVWNGFSSVPVPALLDATGASRTDLSALLAATFVSGGDDLKPHAGRSSADSLQNDIEIVDGLYARHLDRLHRFYRLSRHVSWTIGELDFVIGQLTRAGLAFGIEAATVRLVARLVGLGERLGLDVQRSSGLWSSLPNTSIDGNPGLFTTLFNPAQLDGLWTPLPYDENTQAKFLHPSFNTDPTNPGTSDPHDNTLARLLGGLEVSDQELVELLTRLAPALGMNPTSAALDDRKLRLSISNLTLLYRHAKLASLLGRSIPEFFQLLEVLGIGHNVAGANVAYVDKWTLNGGALADDVGVLLAGNAWLQASSFSLDEVAFAVGRNVLQPDKLPSVSTVVDAIVTQMRSERAFEFADTALSGLPNGAVNLSEDQSRQIIALNAALFESVPDRATRRLKATSIEVKAADLKLPAGVVATAAAVATALSVFSVHALLPGYLAKALATPAPKAAALVRLSGQDTTLDSAAFVESVSKLVYETSQDPSNLEKVVSRLLPFALLYRDDVFDVATLDFIGTLHVEFGFPAGAVKAPSLEAVRLAERYRTLTSAPNPAYTTALAQPDAAMVRAVLGAGIRPAAPGTTPATSTQIADALRTDKARIDALLPHLFGHLPPLGLDALATLVGALDLMTLLGISGETLSDLALPSAAVETQYQRLRRAADGLFAAFRVKYDSDAEFREKVEPYEDKLRSRHRDGLVAYLRFTEPKKFPGKNDLYQYFLLDVAMEGCARTTRVAAAVFSLQLYIHRVLMHLERSDDGSDFVVTPTDAVRAELPWRGSFRMWQAARKVFLNPENYAEPGLRDDKTPLFEELESTLLQERISDENVRDAYAKYLSDFDQLARLKIVAACCAPPKADTLHLFGVTSSEPPQYFYRSIDGLHGAADTKNASFGPWHSIDLNIGAKTCAAIVYQGTLYVFWAEITTQPKTTFANGASVFTGYAHKVTIKYSSLSLAGRWSAPQRLRIGAANAQADQLVVDDPLQFVGVTAKGGEAAPADSQSLIIGPLYDAGTGALIQFKKGDTLPDVSRVEVAPGVLAPSDFKYVFVVGEPKFDPGNPQTEPRDDYTLRGSKWDTPYPTIVGSWIDIGYGEKRYRVDLFSRTATSYDGNPEYVSAQLARLNDANDDVRGIGFAMVSEFGLGNDYYADSIALRDGISGTNDQALVTPYSFLGALTLVAVNGARNSFVMTVGVDASYVRIDNQSTPWTCRLGSTIATGFAETLFTTGLDDLLAVTSQDELREDDPPFDLSTGGTTPTKDLDFSGAVGDYYREIFCHIPWLIADYLHSQGNFADAQLWYHRFFDPTAPDVPKVQPENRRVWQFISFRREMDPSGGKLQTMRDALEDTDALKAFHKDPFNPHAIARLRPGAYEKAAVMQYINNLLDWGDSLFLQFTAESINEATMLYVLAADILGPRSPDVGDCGEGALGGEGKPAKTYENIAPLLTVDGDGIDQNEFVIELENVWNNAVYQGGTDMLADAQATAVAAGTGVVTGGPPTPEVSTVGQAVGFGQAMVVAKPFGWQSSSGALWSMSTGTPLANMRLGAHVDGGEGFVARSFKSGVSYDVQPAPLGTPNIAPPEMNDGLVAVGRQASALNMQTGASSAEGSIAKYVPPDQSIKAKPWQLLQSQLVFCVPDNAELRAYWDRVDDRLFKIRNCMDISGVRRQPDLFGPPIDPHLLLQMSAAGLSLDDVMSVTNGNVPPYRFQHLLEKARQYAGTLQSFGGALLSALEKRDTETLNQLRTVHEQHLLKLRTQIQQFEITSAQQASLGFQAQKQAAEYRRDYYTTLCQTGLNDHEQGQQATRHTLTDLNEVQALLHTLSGILHLLPDLGAPTALKYGGIALGGSSAGFGEAMRDITQGLESSSASSGLEASFQRRDEEWKHQANLAQREVDQLEKQIAAADIRIQIAERSLEVHQTSIDQTEEIFQFYQDRFTGVGLFTWLSKTLRDLHREAFNAAFAMAKLAEQAYRFERPEVDLPTIQGWDPSYAGLLAGERLLLDLQALERSYMESDYRRLEVEQSFSLFQFDPQALVELREKGKCTFDIPELFYDLTYPGHYRRRIKAVRMTLPCVAGAFANAGATLNLLASKVRVDPGSTLADVPARHSVTIATSSGQNDAGVFEFSFRDERFMPFEGAGAVSQWALSLPASFRHFDYQTISDVILRVSYYALEDGDLRKKVEETNATTATVGALLKRLQGADHGGIAPETELQSVVSLRRDAPDTFAQLVRSPVNTPVTLTIDERRKPFFLATRNINVTSASWVLRTKPRTNIAAPTAAFTVNGTPVGTVTGSSLGDAGKDSSNNDVFTLFQSDIKTSISTWFGNTYTLKLSTAGNVAAPNNGPGLDTDEVLDISLHVRYRLAGP